MIKIGILGDIGSGKSYVAQNFGYPVFNADDEVAKLYRTDKKIYKKLNKILPKYFDSFPIEKKAVLQAILAHNNNLKKIVKIVHLEIRKKMIHFLRKNKISSEVKNHKIALKKLNKLLIKQNNSKNIQIKLKKIGEKILQKTYKEIIF